MEKMMTLTILISILTLPLTAPSIDVLYIPEAEVIRPYEAIWMAVCKVESNFNPFAIGDKHLQEWSYGIAQIRQERVTHFNSLSGKNYTLLEMYDPVKAKEVFMYFADRIGPYDVERAIRNWNGKWELTDNYYVKVKKVLELSN